jgi:serine phosphatase RsbU (regulator of sigma subunit)
MVSEKQQLEKEKELFKQKNQKLWEQSMAVYKEKERIDATRKYIESRHANLTQSINYALRIQQALLPSEDLLKQFFPNHFILYRPRNIVSGDFYWTKQINNKTIVAVSDCTGHGVPGAFMSLLGIAFLNEIASKHAVLSASQILEEMRIKVKDAFEQKKGTLTINDGMDMVVCIFDKETHQLEFSGANNGIFIARNDKTIEEVKGTRNPISSFQREVPFKNHTIKLEVNDAVFMYSDGYFDQFGGPKNQKLSKNRFIDTLSESINKSRQMPDIKKDLENFLDDWQGNKNQIDDILVFGAIFS